MAISPLYPRYVHERLVESLSDTPVVLIHGPRQCGKTTLAQEVGRSLGYSYFSFDDDVALAAATEDPQGFVDGLPSLTILDEVQRVPGLFSALKMAVDRSRTPGCFILTGSGTLCCANSRVVGRIQLLGDHEETSRPRETSGSRPVPHASRCERQLEQSRSGDSIFGTAWAAAT